VHFVTNSTIQPQTGNTNAPLLKNYDHLQQTEQETKIESTVFYEHKFLSLGGKEMIRRKKEYCEQFFYKYIKIVSAILKRYKRLMMSKTSIEITHLFTNFLEIIDQQVLILQTF